MADNTIESKSSSVLLVWQVSQQRTLNYSHYTYDNNNRNNDNDDNNNNIVYIL